MAIDDIDILHQELPEVFNILDLPPEWDETWIFIPIDDPESMSAKEDEESKHPEASVGRPPSRIPQGPMVPDLGGNSFPGSPQKNWNGSLYPPPDALAFYLPIHYYFPIWWGIYLSLEGTDWLADTISHLSGGSLTKLDAMAASRTFLYGHELFHHQVECHALRLEVSHRNAIYKVSFERVYRRTRGTMDSIEEALAVAYGYRKVKDTLFKDNKHKRQAVLSSLKEYIKGCPPGYNRGLEFVDNKEFISERCRFAESNHLEAFPNVPRKSPEIWLSFPHAFTGINRVDSRANYVIHIDSPLANRRQLHLRFLTYKDLEKKLRKLLGCEPVRQSGSHVIWKTSGGKTFPIPRHPGDVAKGTLKSIMKQAGLEMSVSEFIETRV